MKNRNIWITTILASIMLVGCNQKESSSNNQNSNNLSSSSKISSLITNSSSNDSTSNNKPVRPHTHHFGEWEILEEADLFNKGQMVRYCESCDENEEKEYYDLSEVRFVDKTYQYNGLERELVIEGLLPQGISVKYENNKSTNIGTIISKANFIDENGETIETKEAALTITPYQGLPEIKVTTLNGAVIDSKETYTNMSLSITNCDEKYSLNNVSGGIRLRGNGTLGANKKPYRIKFDDKQKMLGLNSDAKAKSWVLLAEYYDYSMMRNATAFTLGDSLMNAKGYYSSGFIHINLYINNIFNGVYLLAEQQQVNKNRVDIYEPEDEEQNNLDIGYLLEMDNYADDNPFTVGDASFSATDSNGSKQNLPIRSYSIKSDIYNVEQLNFISKYTNNVYTLMYNAVVLNKYYALDENYDLVESDYQDAYSTINAVIDVDSLIRSYILEEIMKDIDVGFSSYYLFVDFSSESKFKKLTFGAPWDFDWSSGNVTGDFIYKTNGAYNSVFSEKMNPWLFLISQLDNFDEIASSYWKLMQNSGVFENMLNQIDDISTTYKQDFEKNFQKWNVLGTSQHVYHASDVYSFLTQQDASEYLSNWLTNRINYLDTKW